LVKQNIFMSYSRREVSFVNNLVDDLEDNGFDVWLDYRSLVPGTPWAGQIDKGIQESEVVLLVVSKASMASEYVELEWKQVLKLDKRIILAIFEAVDLPPELEKFEWVDFRGNYKKGLEELMRQVQEPEQEEHAAPETGFKMHPLVWVAAALSVVLAFCSLGAIWTLFLPYLLVPLPYRIFKRDYNFVQVQAALVLLPFALYLTTTFVESDAMVDLSYNLLYACMPFTVALLFVLRSPALQRWGKPVATLPKFANLYEPDNPNPELIPFFVDHAPQDRVAAQDLSDALEAYGHPRVDDMGVASAIFVLVSRFKTGTQADPQKQVVYPVILQTTDTIQENLQKVQWIDFRNGFRNLDALAQLLPDPAELLKALGIRPMGNQVILPPVIQYFIYFVIVLAIFTVGSWLPYLIQFAPDIIDYSDADFGLFMLAINLVLFVATSFFMVRVTNARHPRWASQRLMFVAMLGLGALIAWQYFFINDMILEAFGVFENVNDFRGFSAEIPPIIYVAGNVLMSIFVFLKRADMRRWFPAK
jgi:TIR domain